MPKPDARRYVVDTSVIIRFITNDIPSKAEEFEALLASEQLLVMTDVTFAEIYWTLSSFYQFPKPKILEALEALIWHNNLIANVGVLAKTIEFLRAENVSFIDAHTAAVAVINFDNIVLSYDRDFDKFGEVIRVES